LDKYVRRERVKRFRFYVMKIFVVGVLLAGITIISTTFLSLARDVDHANDQFVSWVDNTLVKQITTLSNTTELTHHVYLPIIGHNPYFTASIRQLTACENQGRHHLFITVVSSTGEELSDVPIKISWSAGFEEIITDSTVITTDNSGKAEFTMFKVNYWAEVASGTGKTVGPVTTTIDSVEICEDTGEVGNSLFHYSYEIVFTKVQ
jgi:hypothetical protein